jgi:hypothetical protein
MPEAPVPSLDVSESLIESSSFSDPNSGISKTTVVDGLVDNGAAQLLSSGFAMTQVMDRCTF